MESHDPRRPPATQHPIHPDAQSAILADLFPDDVNQEFGVLVTPDRRVIEFVVYYGCLGDLNRKAANATIGEASQRPAHAISNA